MNKGIIYAMVELKNVCNEYGDSVFKAAIHALRIQNHRPEMSSAMAIKLADRLENLSLRCDEPRFTTEDYIDAICSDRYSLGGIVDLCHLNDDEFDERVIRDAEEERLRYE